MRTKIKQATTIIALLLLCTIFLSCMGGCGKKDSNRFYTELFSCKYNKDKSGVIILELTEKGQEQEILVIPEEINGLPVVQLGGDTRGYPYARAHTLQSEKVRKIYCLCGNANWITPYNNFECKQDVDILVRKETISAFSPAGHNCNNHFYSDIKDEREDYGLYSIEKCNVFFNLIEKDNIDVYWMDIINENDYHIIPPEPRRDGYSFNWYADKECTILWENTFELSESKKELNLYAKWIKQ